MANLPGRALNSSNFQISVKIFPKKLPTKQDWVYSLYKDVIRMTFKEFDELIQRYIQGNCTESEEHLIEKWYSKLEKEDGLVLDKQQQLLVEKRLWSKLEERSAPRPSQQRFLPNWQISRIAASILLVAISLFVLINKTDLFKGIESSEGPVEELVAIINTGPSFQKITLEDGSSVSLESGSELRYTVSTFRTSREVHLIGEAFFEVAEDKSHPFLVYSGGLTTKVLGTTFRVKAYRDQEEIIVSVTTGKVSVFTQPGQNAEEKVIDNEVILTPNQQAIYNKADDKVARKLIDDPQIVLAKPTLKTHYYNVAVSEIFETLEKNYGIDIEFDVIRLIQRLSDLS